MRQNRIYDSLFLVVRQSFRASENWDREKADKLKGGYSHLKDSQIIDKEMLKLNINGIYNVMLESPILSEIM